MMTITLPDRFGVDYHKVNWDILLSNFCSQEGITMERTTCPYQSLHSAASTNKDFYYNTTVCTDGFMLIGASCWHEKCRPSINSMLSTLNKKWKKYVDTNNDKVKIIAKTPQQIEADNQAELTRIMNMVARKKQREDLISKIKLNLKPIEKVSPVFSTPTKDLEYHLSLFKDDDIIFLGSFYDTTLYQLNDKDLERLPSWPEFTSTYTFKTISDGRNADNCKDKPYGVLELDNGLPKEKQLSFLLSIEKTLNIRLLMALDSGGKSVHGWFSWTDLEPYVDVFFDLTYDMKTLKTRSQPVRLAGSFRQNKQQYQRIIYAI